MRRVRCRPSSTNSTAAATCPGVASSPCPSRSSTLDRPGTGPTWASRSAPGTSLAGLDDGALGEEVREAGEVEARQARAVRLGDGEAQQVRQHVALATLLAHLELDLAEEGGHDGGDVADPRDGIRLPGAGGPAERGAGHALGPRDGEPRGHTRALVDGRRLTQPAREARHDLEEVLGHVGDERGLLSDEGDLVADLGRVVRADLGTEAVLERRDDAAAVRVVLRVGRRDEQDVERQAQRVAADLDVALLEHVEEGDLDALGEVGQAR